MKNVEFDLRRTSLSIHLPSETDVLAMSRSGSLLNPEDVIEQTLQEPNGTPSLFEIAHKKNISRPDIRAVIVISDNTRPVPYSGREGILWPIIQVLKSAGLKEGQIHILVATGSHHPMPEEDIQKLLDPRVLESNIPITNHDCRNSKDLINIGKSDLLGDIRVNRLYLESDIKILTGLVESHFMAGASGGRKSICPGIISEESTQLIHGGKILSSPKARDLVFDGNPVHEESLRVARMTGCDFIVNVTLDSDLRLSGVFSGNMEAAHTKAVEKLKSYVAIPVTRKYDLVVSHAGYVGINHYQAAKAGTICASILKDGGRCILAGFHTDIDPVGSENYKRMLRLLNDIGPDKYEERIQETAWEFVPDQWEPQMWGRLFKVIPPENLIYCSLEIPAESFAWIPGTDGRILAPEAQNLEELVNRSLVRTIEELKIQLGRKPSIAVLKDGPYGIPIY